MKAYEASVGSFVSSVGPVPGGGVGAGVVSFGQERLWFLDELVGGGALYNAPFVVRVSGCDVGVLGGAVQGLVDRHEALRSGVRTVGGRPVSVVAGVGVEVSWSVVSVGGEGEAWDVVRAGVCGSFDLSVPPLVRGGFVEFGGVGEGLLWLVFHHAVCDGWSLGVLQEELREFYGAGVEGREVVLPEVSLSFGDFAVWERERLSGGVLDEGVGWWRGYLEGAPGVLSLPGDRVRPAVQSYVGDMVVFDVPGGLVDGVRGVARECRSTVFHVLMAAFDVVVGRWSRQEDVVVGVPGAGRSGAAALDRVVGFFANMLPVRVDVGGDPSFVELVRRVRGSAVAAQGHEEVPFSSLVDALVPERESSWSPLVQVTFSVNPVERRRWEWGGGAEGEIGSVHTGTAKFDLGMLVFDAGADGMWGEVEFASDLFNASTVRRFVDQWLAVLGEVTADPRVRLSELRGMPAAEVELLRSWSRGGGGDLVWESVDEGVVARALERPGAVAVRDRGVSVSYGELVARADGVAAALRAVGVGRGGVVGLCVERSADLVVGMLGVLRAGAAYVALDPEYPRERLAFMLEDSGARVVVGHEYLFDRLPLDGRTTIDIDQTRPVPLTPDTANGIGRSLERGDDLAYLIYTSGSTGRPKGVAVRHRNLGSLMAIGRRCFDFGAEDVWSLFHSASFDFSVWETWGALANGGCLVVVPPELARDPAGFHRLVSEACVTVLNVTPTAFGRFEEADAQTPAPLALRKVIFGGEAVDLSAVRRWWERHQVGAPDLINMFGITEVTVHATVKTLTPEALDDSVSPIGVPLPGYSIRVLGPDGREQPIGVAGEIHISGAGVAAGYLNRPELTAERFLPIDPENSRAGVTYASGDLARWLPSGELEYVGRADQQVKIRGFRVETGEVEAVLGAHPQVDSSVVTVTRDEDTPRLVAYCVPAAGAETSVNDLRDHLAARLPSYMVPALIILIDEIPLNANGKADLARLPSAEFAHAETREEYLAPSSEQEKILADVWCEVLGVNRVGVRENFFDLGGDSIRSVQVLAAARSRGLTFDLQHLFQHRTVERLAPLCTSHEARAQELKPFSMVSTGDRARMPADAVDAYPMTALQMGMIYEMEADSRISPYLNVDSFGMRARFDESLFRRAVDDVVLRHEILRTSFHLSGYDDLLQVVHEMAELSVVVEDVRELAEAERSALVDECVRRERGIPFDVNIPGLLRFFIHVVGDGEFQWTLVEHHAILDGWSLNSTIGEIIGRYALLLEDPEAPRESAPVSRFREFVALERADARSAASRAFWEEAIGDWDALRLPRLPSAERGDALVPVGDVGDGERVSPEEGSGFGSLETRLDPAVSEGLVDVTRRLGLPLKCVLLGAHLAVMSKLTGHRSPTTGLLVNGRLEGEGGTDTRGLFLNSVPFSVPVEGTMADVIRAVFARDTEILPHRRFPHTEIRALAGGAQLYETHFIYNHFHVLAEALGAGEVGIVSAADGTYMTARSEPTNWPFACGFMREPGSDGLVHVIDYHTAEFTGEQVRGYRDCYLRLLRALAEDPYRRVDTIDVLSDEERRAFSLWNSTAADLVWESVDEGVVARALERPGAVAVRDRGVSVS
ncbi:amino acid adenylation domain-containing protein, partial [Streptomyces sp. NPDC058665]|uniref:amino acid adenylation domain-containing protein n=1 Tax=Streptomyces sp. NPDC058665 TaxID=3346586 RepID=UPI00365EE8EF